jgi:hypothetical protein
MEKKTRTRRMMKKQMQMTRRMKKKMKTRRRMMKKMTTRRRMSQRESAPPPPLVSPHPRRPGRAAQLLLPLSLSPLLSLLCPLSLSLCLSWLGKTQHTRRQRDRENIKKCGQPTRPSTTGRAQHVAGRVKHKTQHRPSHNRRQARVATALFLWSLAAMLSSTKS